MAKLDPAPLVQALVVQLAEAADDQFEFAALLAQAKLKLHEAHMAQLGQNGDRVAEVLIAERAKAAGLTPAQLTAELAAVLGRTAAAVKPSELLEVVKVRAAATDPKVAKP